MAVINDYVDSALAAGQKSSSKGAFAPGHTRIITFEVAAADSDGSVYRLQQVSANEVPYYIRLGNDAITAGTSYDLGLYLVGAGAAVVDKDILLAAADLSSARATLTLDGMTAVDIANYGKSFGELLDAVNGAGTNTAAAYDLALTANTVGSAAGTITLAITTK